MDPKSPPSDNETAADLCLSERRWRRMQRLARIGVWDWDQRTNHIWFSDEALTLFGLSPGPNERPVIEWIDRVHPEDRDRIDRIAAEHRGRLRSYELTYRTVHPDGTVRHLHEYVEALLDESGAWIGTSGATQDVTEWQEAQQQTEALLHAFMDNAPFEMVVKDLADRYLMVNRGMSKAWGLPIDAFIGRRLSEIRETPGVDLVEALDREVMETGTTVTREIYYSEFGDYWSRAVKFPIRDPDGRTVAIGGISIDISESKRSERETVDAKEQAVSASQAKSMFLANMSHELRTPLNAIIGFSDIIAQQLYGPSSDRYVRYANDIMDSAHHLLGIVNSILDTTKIEAGKFQLAEELCSVNAVVDSAMRMLAERAESKNVKLESRVAPDLPPVRADERALRQILINLMFNAVKFTHMGGRVMVTADTAADGSLRLRVDDTGVGIAADDMAKVFDRFSQIGDAYTRLQGGTGLGLHVSRKLVELHQGTIEIDSTPGTGTTVTVLLPAWRWSEIPKQRPMQTA
jgi:PAS domain S-box-containing protein